MGGLVFYSINELNCIFYLAYVVNTKEMFVNVLFLITFILCHDCYGLIFLLNKRKALV